MDSKSYPMLSNDQFQQLKLDISIGEKLSYLSSFISENSIRPFQTCLWIKDGYLICTNDITSVLPFYIGIDKDIDILIPKRAIPKLSETIPSSPYIGYNENKLIIRTDFETFTSKMINDKAPPFERIISSISGEDISVPRLELLDALNLATLDSDYVSLAFNKNVLSISNHGVDSKNSSSMDINVNSPFIGVFNSAAKYIKLFLKNSIEDNVNFTLPNTDFPGLFSDSKSSLVIMPTKQQ